MPEGKFNKKHQPSLDNDQAWLHGVFLLSYQRDSSLCQPCSIQYHHEQTHHALNDTSHQFILSSCEISDPL